MVKKIFSVEGNIGSGKSTIIEKLKLSGEHFIYLQEPVHIWNEIKDSSGVTILEKFYNDKKRYSFSFQMMAYITRLSQLKRCIDSAPEDCIIITERCLYTDRYVFAQMLYDSNLIEDIEYSIYLYWFDEFITFNLDALIYIQTDPAICLQRTKTRNRKGEELIPLEYLCSCHKYHESFIDSFKNKTNVFVYDGNGNINLNIIIDFILNFVKKG